MSILEVSEIFKLSHSARSDALGKLRYNLLSQKPNPDFGLKTMRCAKLHPAHPCVRQRMDLVEEIGWRT